MSNPTPDPLWDGIGTDPELSRLEDLLSTYGGPPPLPALPRRRRAVFPTGLLAAAALVLGVGGVFVLGSEERAAPWGEGAPIDGASSGTLGTGVESQDDPAVGRDAREDAGTDAGSGSPARRGRSGDGPGAASGSTGAGRDGASAAGGAAAGGGGGASGSEFVFYEDEMGISANPVHELSMSDVRLNELIHASLWAPGPLDRPQPMLVEDARLDESGRVLTIQLKDVAWSDGKPVTAEDVVFTVKAFKDPASKSLDRHRWDFIREVEAEDETTVRLVFDRSFRSVPAERLYLKVVPKHPFDDPGISRLHGYGKRPTAAGAYTVVEKTSKGWVLRANARSLRASRVGTVRTQEVPEKRTQAELMSYKYGHAMISVEPQQRAELDADPCCTLKPYPLKSWWFTAFNQKHAALSDAKVRRALSLAVDRQQALDLIGEGELISGPFTPSSRYYNHDVAAPTLDASGAAALLEEAGYTKPAGQWTKGGATIDLRFFYDEALGEQGQTVATNLVGQLKRFGINVSAPAAIPSESWEERILDRGDYDLVLGSWSFDVNEDVGQLFGSDGARNFVDHRDPRTDELLAAAYESRDPSEQQAIMKDLHRRLGRTAPYLFLWTTREYSAVSKSVQGAQIQPFYYFTQFSNWSVAAQ